MSRPKVYFIKEITGENIVKIYNSIGKELKGPIAVKVHSGELGNQNFLRPQLFVEIMNRIDNGTICECNTAFPGERIETYLHWQLMEDHEWTKVFPGKVDILDEYQNPEQDLHLPINDGYKLKMNYGYGAALKQLSIGCCSQNGKANIHTGGVSLDPYTWMAIKAEQHDFLDGMADAATSVVRYFNTKGGSVFINVLKNISIDCDCMPIAADPCMADIGICGSVDPVAADQACIDLLIGSADEGKKQILDRIKSMNGYRTLKRCDGRIGSRNYELVEIH